MVVDWDVTNKSLLQGNINSEFAPISKGAFISSNLINVIYSTITDTEIIGMHLIFSVKITNVGHDETSKCRRAIRTSTHKLL